MRSNKEILLKFISTQGYKRNSPDKNRPVNVIPSNKITMEDVDFPVRGIDDLGNEMLMMPGGEYEFPGNYVVETPELKSGGEMIKRADGSYSRRGLWDNIRANKGSGKKPTKEMLEQERKIRMEEKEKGGTYYDDGRDAWVVDGVPGHNGPIGYQEGGTTGIDNAISEISNMIMQGEDPSEIYGTLLENGLDEDQAKDILEEAMERLQETDVEEEEIPMDEDEMTEFEMESEAEEMKNGGSIKINPAKKGTFKAQATKMGMSVQEAASYILRHKDEFSPAMVKKANFAKNFAKELGGEIYNLEQFKNGGGIPERYRNMGFTRVGAKRKSTRPGKKWMVLAKKGDQYKVVHGGWKGMSDYTQHRNKNRRKRFWDRMGGRDSSKAKDPFSPLYWHKRFGTWQEGGQTNMFNYAEYRDGDIRQDITTSRTIDNLKYNNFNRRGLAGANALGDPRNMMWALPNKGLLGTIKAVAGAAAGVSGAALGYSKMFAKPKTESYITNYDRDEYGKMSEVVAGRTPKTIEQPKAIGMPAPNPTVTPTGPTKMNTGNFFMNNAEDERRFRDMGVFEMAGVVHPIYLPEAQMSGQQMTFKDWFTRNATRPDVLANTANQALLMEMWRKEVGNNKPAANAVTAATPAATGKPAIDPLQTPTPQTWSSSTYGDSAGQIAANNALAGFGMLNSVLDARNNEKEYEKMLRRVGNTDQRYDAYNPTNAFGNYTLNAGPGSNFALVTNTPIQDFGTTMAGAKYGGTAHYAEGGEYYATDEEIKMILAMGGEIEFLD